MPARRDALRAGERGPKTRRVSAADSSGLHAHPHPLTGTPALTGALNHPAGTENTSCRTPISTTQTGIKPSNITAGELISSLNTALAALTQASTAIAALTSNQVYDVEFAESHSGADVARLPFRQPAFHPRGLRADPRRHRPHLTR
jgi:hypothetical protein